MPEATISSRAEFDVQPDAEYMQKLHGKQKFVMCLEVHRRQEYDWVFDSFYANMYILMSTVMFGIMELE